VGGDGGGGEGGGEGGGSEQCRRAVRMTRSGFRRETSEVIGPDEVVDW